MTSIDAVQDIIVPGVFYGAFILAALIAAASIPLLFIGGGKLAKSINPSTRLSSIFILMVIGTIVPVAVSGRRLLSDRQILLEAWQSNLEPSSKVGQLVSQICTAAIIFIACAEIFRWLVTERKLKSHSAPLWLSMISFFFFSVIASAAFGTLRQPTWKMFYAPVTLSAIVILAQEAKEGAWTALRWAALLPTVGSLIAMAVAPDLALLPDFNESMIPGFPKRLYGLTSQANSLAVFAAIGLALEFCPRPVKRPNTVLIALHATALALTQSKTAWAGATLAVAIIQWDSLKHSFAIQGKFKTKIFSIILAVAALIILTLGLTYTANSSKVLTLLENMGAFSLTGRTKIWEITFNEFLNNPLTGYGPSLWDPLYRYQQGMLHVGQAHNQFLQTLGQSGALGFAALIIYIACMLRAAYIGRSVNKSLSLALMALLITRCFSESPLILSTVLGSDWIHFVTLGVIAASAAQAQKASPRLQASTDIYPITQSK